MKLGTCRHCGATLVQGAFGCPRCGHLVDDQEVVDTGSANPTQLGTQAKDALLEGQWRLIERLGRGRRATVWLAQDVSFDRKVALKVLDEALAADPAEVERFERDARRLAAIDHKNVVPVMAMGASGGVPFVVMRRAEGRSLAEHVHARGGKLAPGEAAHLAQQLCEAFEAVHAGGGAQGGLQPRHVFVADDGRVTLLDVRAAARPADEQTAAFDGVAGLAPEVLRGSEPSVRSDVFALGCLLWELVAGAPPDRGALAQVLLGQAGPVPEVAGDTLARGLQAAIMRAVSDDEAARFASAAELGAALAAFAAAPILEIERPGTKTGIFVDLPAAAAVEAPTAPQEAPVVRRRTRDDFKVPVSVLAAAPVTKPLSLLDDDDDKPPAGERAQSTRQFDAVELELKRTLAASERPTLPIERRRRTAYAIAGMLVALLFLAWSFDRRGERSAPLPERIAGLDPSPPPVATESIATAPVPESVRERQQLFVHVHDDAAALKDGRRVKGAARVGRRVSDYPIFDARHQPMSELEVEVLLKSKKVEADVHIDGKLIGPSPVFLPVRSGVHTVGVERRPMATDDVPITVPPGKSVRVEIELEPLTDGATAP